ncbi:hypothetical protein [Brevibacillus choshinensis]|nr:hypothetical protein [Brevibacillus choshinensis]
MWKAALSVLPDWTVFVQAFIVILVPYLITRFIKWIHTSLEE